MLARYNFAARMLAGYREVLEVGCADGFGARVVRQALAPFGQLLAVDVDERSIEEARRLHYSVTWPVEYRVHDILRGPLPGHDAVYSLDVFEHIAPESEHRFLYNLRESAPVAIIGTPSLESQPYASALSRAGHVNCKSGEQLREALLRHWRHVFLFGMNDQALHTGLPEMSHYLLALAVA